MICTHWPVECSDQVKWVLIYHCDPSVYSWGMEQIGIFDDSLSNVICVVLSFAQSGPSACH